MSEHILHIFHLQGAPASKLTMGSLVSIKKIQEEGSFSGGRILFRFHQHGLVEVISFGGIRCCGIFVRSFLSEFGTAVLLDLCRRWEVVLNMKKCNKLYLSVRVS